MFCKDTFTTVMSHSVLYGRKPVIINIVFLFNEKYILFIDNGFFWKTNF